MEYVIKRDGAKKEFCSTNLYNSMKGAFEEVDGELTKDGEKKIKSIIKYIEAIEDTKTVEEIQDIVEEKLMASNRKDVAKAYILYRDKRSRIRDMKSTLRREINEKLSASNVQNQNANVDEYSFGGRIGEASSTLTKQIALDNFVSPMVRKNHLNNEIYTHDLDSYVVGSHNCLSVPFDDLLANGFTTRQTDVRPAKSINTAFQLLAVIFQLQSLQEFGGVSATHLDYTMKPYVRMSFWKHYNRIAKRFPLTKPASEEAKTASVNDRTYYTNPIVRKMALEDTETELKQAVEGMYHNLNTLQSRSGCQLPFTSINFGTDVSTEGRMVSKALLEGCLNGVGKFNRTSIFPCVIFKLKKGVNRKKGDPNYDLFRLALRCTAQRLYPNYANVDWSGNEGYDPNDPKTEFSTMG